ncbi:MAG: PepSY domain-containing protein [Pseudomonadota bacterium]
MIQPLSRRIHAALAFIFALPLLLVSLSGALLGFARESDRIMHVDLVSAPFSSAPAQSLEALRSAVLARYPGYSVVETHPAKTTFDSALFVMRDAENSLHEVYIHTQTAEIRGSRPAEDNFYAQVRTFHTTLAMGETGAWITRLAALGLLLTSLSGLLLRRQTYRHSLSARLHPLLGVTAAPVLLLIASTGLTLALFTADAPWLQQLHTGEFFAMPGRVLWVLASLAVPLLVYGGIASYRARTHLKNESRHA